MALERFLDMYPGDPGLLNQLQGEQQRNQNFDSAPSYLASRLISNAASELKTRHDIIIREKNLPRTRETGMIVFKMAGEEVAAIRYGALILGLADAAESKHFDHHTFASRTNFGLTGTLLPSFEIPSFVRQELEPLSPDEVRTLLDAKSIDPSFLSMISAPYKLPSDLRNTLDDEGLLEFEFVHRLAQAMSRRMQSLCQEVQQPREFSPNKTELNSLAFDEINAILEDF